MSHGSVAHPPLPKSCYSIALKRPGSQGTEVWPLALADALPTVPVPLREADGEVALDLGAALRSIYEEAAYELSIDYGEAPPPPKLSDEERDWVEKLVTHEAPASY